MTAASLFDAADRGATISPCGAYRYDLWRRWDDGPVLGFIMLNPSTANSELDDPTIRRCIGFARRERLAGIVVRNLFAFRTAKPKVLEDAARRGLNVVGADNDDWLRTLAGDRVGVHTIVAAWGACSSLRVADPGRRMAEVRQIFAEADRELHALRWPDAGGPTAPHPLYLKRDTPLVRA